MSIERAIHERWAIDAPLSALLPSARLSTGPLPLQAGLPCATLARVGTSPVLRTSSGTVLCEARLELSIFADELAAAQTIADEVDRTFCYRSLPLALGRGLLVRPLGRDETREEPRGWRITLTLLVLYEMPERGITTHV